MKASVALCVLALLLAGCSKPRKAGARDSAAGTAEKGSAVTEGYSHSMGLISLALTTSGPSVAVGDSFDLSCTITNATQQSVFVQTRRPYGFYTTRLIVSVPGGSKFLYDPYALKKMPEIDESYYVALPPGESVELFKFSAVAGAVHHGESCWSRSRSGERRALPFSSAGRYAVRAQYHDTVPKHKGGYTGHLAADVSIEVLK